MSATVETGINQRRADAVMLEACQLITGLEALAGLGGRQDDDTVPAVTVRWFCTVFEEHAHRILRYLDQCEPEPPAPIRAQVDD